MWIENIENPESISIVYGGVIPKLNSIFLNHLEVTNGEDLICELHFDIKILPALMPAKWVAKSVDTVQIKLQLISCEILSLEMRGGEEIGELQIDAVNDVKLGTFLANKRKIFSIRSKWIRIGDISGYTMDSWQSLH
jgi:hypothetical protein